jgi:hypothetical protein
MTSSLKENIDKIVLALSILFIFFTPIMLLNGRIQISDFIFVFLSLAFLIQVILRKSIYLGLMKESLLGMFVLLSSLSSIFSFIYSDFSLSLIFDLSAQLYPMAIFVICYLILVNNKRNFDYLLSSQSFAYTAVISIGILAAFFSFLGFDNSYAPINNQIAKVLMLEDSIPELFRIHSTLGPTSKLFGTYSFLLLLPFIAFLSYKKYSSLFILTVFYICFAVSTFSLSKTLPSLFLISFFFFAFFRRYSLMNSLFKYISIFLFLGSFIAVQLLSIVYGVETFYELKKNFEHKKEIISVDEKDFYNRIYFYNNDGSVYDLKLDFTLAFNHYYHLKKAAYESWKQRPILGHGPGSYRESTLMSVKDAKVTKELGFKENSYTDAQSEYMNQLAERGALGLLAFLLLWFYSIFLLFRSQSNDLAKGFGFGMIAMVFTLVDLQIYEFRFIWVGLAIALASISVLSKNEKCVV